MKHYTGKTITQKILIVLITVVMLSFSIPKPVQADFGGMLMSPLTALATGVVDGIQWVLEWAMLGRPHYFMEEDLKDHESDAIPEGASHITITKEEYGKIDGALFGWDHANIPDMRYTPENIFANRIPALDVNFISPSVKTGDPNVDLERNIAMKLQPTIASWYLAIRIFAVVGLLSVLIYLGIRILITSIAADKAKYKKMLMDWFVAVCLIFALHYIMSLALTGAETLTALIGDSIGGDLYVTVQSDAYDGSKDITFKTNLTNYVRFMIQSEDFGRKVGFFFLYLMLVIYNIRFTWVYLKRVVNMAFLTLIAPIVALSYPIDKVGDSKAQAFDLWVKEFVFNAILQPLHLLLYVVLLGSATQLAVTNPLYAIVCLGFILTAEKLLKSMLGFNKAGGGTVGSLAGAAGVTALANKALMSLGKKPQEHGKGNGKVRTNEKYQREGKDPNANKDYQAFDKASNQGLLDLPSDDDATPPPIGGTVGPDETQDSGNDAPPRETLDDLEQQRAELYNQGYTDNSDEIKELNERINNGDYDEKPPAQTTPNTEGSPNPRMTQDLLEDIGPEEPTFFGTVAEDIRNFGGRIGDRVGQAKDFGGKLLNKDTRRQMMINGKQKVIKGIRRNAIAAWKAAPTVAYSATRGTLKTAARGAAALALGATAGVIAATNSDGEKAVSAAMVAAGAGLLSGGSAFENTIGQRMHERSSGDAFGAAKHGSAIDARNARADKEYLRSIQHQEEYEKYFRNKMSKQEFTKATKSYRQSGITDTKTIRKALKLEEAYVKNGADPKDARGKVQNIVQTYDGIEKAAFRNKEAKEATLKNIESQLTQKDAKQRRAIANEIFQGYIDWRNA